MVEELTLCMTGCLRLAGRHFRPEVRDPWAKWQIDTKPWLNDNRWEVGRQSKTGKVYGFELVRRGIRT